MKPGASNNDIIKMKKLHRQGYDVEKISRLMRIDLVCVKSHLGEDKVKLGDQPEPSAPAVPYVDEDAIPADLAGTVAEAEAGLSDNLED